MSISELLTLNQTDLIRIQIFWAIERILTQQLKLSSNNLQLTSRLTYIFVSENCTWNLELFLQSFKHYNGRLCVSYYNEMHILISYNIF
jgi:hypothetical protein